MTEDTKLYEDLFVRYFKPLCAFVYSYIPNVETAKDIAQDTFTALWNSRDKYSPSGTLIYTIAKNKTIDHLKTNARSKRHSGIPSEILLGHLHSTTQDDLDLKEMIDRVWEFVETLPPQCKRVFLMSRRDDLKNKEIAQSLDISVKAVEKQIAKAQLMLREHLPEYKIIFREGEVGFFASESFLSYDKNDTNE
jgi:RNA polymerase sigma-70 factor (ECF subfamily)